jgi:hypothetical protein
MSVPIFKRDKVTALLKCNILPNMQEHDWIAFWQNISNTVSALTETYKHLKASFYILLANADSATQNHPWFTP